MAAAIAIGIASIVGAVMTARSNSRIADINEKSIDTQAKSESETRATQLAAQERQLREDRDARAQVERQRIEDRQVADNARREDLTYAERARAETLTESREARLADLEEVKASRLSEQAYRDKRQADAVAMDKQRYDAYVNANTPYWQAGQQVFGSLLDVANVARGGPVSGSGSSPNPAVGAAPMRSGATPVAAPVAAAAQQSQASAVRPSSGGAVSLQDLARMAQQEEAATTARPASRGLTAAISQPMPRMAPLQGASGMSLMDLIKMAIEAGPKGASARSPIPNGAGIQPGSGGLA